MPETDIIKTLNSPAQLEGFFKIPLWLVGFRPFFICAILSGCFLPVLWAFTFSGFANPGIINPLQWHIHEMLFGFGWAVMAGFLLTASKNWVKIRGMHGALLALAVACWIFERFSFFLHLSTPVLLLISNSSVALVAGYVASSLVRYRNKDSFKDNWLFVAALPLFLAAKVLILLPGTFQIGWSMAIGLFRLAFLIMLERTTVQFMKSTFQISLNRNSYLDFSIKLLGLISVFEFLLPRGESSVLLTVLAALILIRLSTWHPFKGMSNFGISVMYVGHVAIPIHLMFQVLTQSLAFSFVGNLSVHTFTFLTMGTVIPAMLIRISQGHTGRPIQFTTSDRSAIFIMWSGAFFRLVATQFFPSHYQIFIILAAISWSLCFAIIGLRIVPFLLKPRLDGKEH